MDIFPELSKMESIFSQIQSICQYTIIRSVMLRPVGKLKEFLAHLDKGFMRRFEHITWLNLQQSSLSSGAAAALTKMLPSFELLEELSLSEAGLDEVDVEKVLLALKSCKKLKRLYLIKQKQSWC